MAKVLASLLLVLAVFSSASAQHKHHKGKLLCPHKLKKMYMIAIEEADENLKKELEKTAVRMVEEIGKKKAELKAVKLKLALALKNPNVSADELRKIYREFSKQKEEFMNLVFEYMMRLRESVGAQKFAEIFKKVRMHHRKMMMSK